MNTLSNRLFSTWTYVTGSHGWTKKQVWFGLLFSLALPISIRIFSNIAGLEWNWVQAIAVGLIAWDLGGGIVGYNHQSIKVRQRQEQHKRHYFFHNLQHIHPLIIIFFNNQNILLGLTIYWFLSISIYVRLLTFNQTIKSRILKSKSQQQTAIFIELLVAAGIIASSFLVEGVNPKFQLFGITAYVALIILTSILIRVPVVFQRSTSMAMVIGMIMVSMYIGIPEGFIWLYPLYYLKLLTGYTANEPNGYTEA